MAGNVSPVFTAVPNVSGVQITSANTTVKLTLFTAGANGARVDAILCSTNDTADVNLDFYATIGGTDFYIGVVKVPLGSGYTTVVRVDAMTTLKGAAFPGLVLPASALIKVACVATMTVAKTTDILALAGDF